MSYSVQEVDRGFGKPVTEIRCGDKMLAQAELDDCLFLRVYKMENGIPPVAQYLGTLFKPDFTDDEKDYNLFKLLVERIEEKQGKPSGIDTSPAEFINFVNRKGLSVDTKYTDITIPEPGAEDILVETGDELWKEFLQTHKEYHTLGFNQKDEALRLGQELDQHFSLLDKIFSGKQNGFSLFTRSRNLYLLYNHYSKILRVAEESKEEVVEEQPIIATVPTEIIDPWEVDIPEIENVAQGGRR